MNELEALLAGIVSEPHEETRWLVLADWLEENDDPRRGELLRLHRKLLATCCEPDVYPDRTAWQARVVELIAGGVSPCVPQREVELPDGGLMTFSFIPPSSFLMGGNVNDDEKPVHKVTLTKGFFMGVFPVSQAEWIAVMGSEPSRFKGANLPVEQVSWDECQEFCKSLTKAKGRGSVSLPTEAEWEYACRAGTTSEYHYGDAITPDLVNYNGKHSWNGSSKGKYRESTTVDGVFSVNAWGVYDVHGNVWEWCRDWYEREYAGDQTDPHGNSDEVYREKGMEEYRVLRGGSWFNNPESCRSARRFYSQPVFRSGRIGFRVCFRPE